ncbi:MULTISPECIES: hypothetical protein [unclassified Acidovorax]|uniref:hypothetical protein n=1 Tax=unclassified Acidovorax TaxID=2684926 RepID=UPI000B3F9255|nr:MULTISPECIES: hypothetical protein [unclassified Acidovorax]
MKLYKIAATGNPGSTTPDTETHWVGSQADAASRRKQLNADGFKRADIETHEVDVPTDKAGLLAWLNANV